MRSIVALGIFHDHYIGRLTIERNDSVYHINTDETSPFMNQILVY